MLAKFTQLQEQCLSQGLTLLVAWSLDEAAGYLASLKQWGSKHGQDSSGFLGENKRAHTHTMSALEALSSVCRLAQKDSIAILRSY